MACFEYVLWQCSRACCWGVYQCNATWHVLSTYHGNAVGQVVGVYISAICTYRGNAVGQVVGVYISAICTYRGNAVGQVVGVYISAMQHGMF